MTALSVLAGALADARRSWRPLVQVDLLYKAIAFIALTPLTGLLLRALIARTGSAAVADADIALFFFTTKSGTAALILVSALAIAIVALEQACLMTIGLCVERGAPVLVRDAFAHAAKRAFSVLRLAVLLVLRVLLIVAPFGAALGATYWGLLRAHDINYYLKEHPPEFWVALAIAAGIVLALLAVLARFVSAWLITLPIVVFEKRLPVLAFGESARRMEGRRGRAAAVLAVWAAAAILLPILTTQLAQVAGRAMAPAFGGTLAGLLVFSGIFASLWGGSLLAVSIATTTLFAMIVTRFYHEGSWAGEVALPVPFRDELEIEGRRVRISWRAIVAVLLVGVALVPGLAYLVLKNVWADRPVLVLAHRGAAAEAPENTLAAFRLAGEQRTDFVELDVQESSDGVVLVVHDVDLMKVGRSPLKIWESTAERLRAVDIGSAFSPAFSDQRVPTLAEALAACKGVSKVDIELKDYGHDQRLEERVVEIVEAAGMQDHIVTMSLSHEMVEKMKSLRPAWTAGLLTAKALGDLTRLPADFLAVESRMATRRFIRSAHAAEKPVYVWTVDDPHRMVRMIGLGVDGLITNRPALAREVVQRFAAMSRPQRLFLFIMTRFGGHQEISEPESNLRP